MLKANTRRAPDFVLVWRLMQDRLFPALRLSPHERALYVFLVRHTRLAGLRRAWFTKSALARGVAMCPSTVRHYVRSLARAGCIRILERSARGLHIEVLLPADLFSARGPRRVSPSAARARNAHNEFRDPRLRRAIFRRERGLCFYCLRRLRTESWALDHVVPLAAGGTNSARNAVACCHECNCRKAEMPAADFLRLLFRDACLSAAELRSRLAALSCLSRSSRSTRSPSRRS